MPSTHLFQTNAKLAPYSLILKTTTIVYAEHVLHHLSISCYWYCCDRPFIIKRTIVMGIGYMIRERVCRCVAHTFVALRIFYSRNIILFNYDNHNFCYDFSLISGEKYGLTKKWPKCPKRLIITY